MGRRKTFGPAHVVRASRTHPIAHDAATDTYGHLVIEVCRCGAFRTRVVLVDLGVIASDWTNPCTGEDT